MNLNLDEIDLLTTWARRYANDEPMDKMPRDIGQVLQDTRGKAEQYPMLAKVLPLEMRRMEGGRIGAYPAADIVSTDAEPYRTWDEQDLLSDD